MRFCCQGAFQACISGLRALPGNWGLTGPLASDDYRPGLWQWRGYTEKIEAVSAAFCWHS